jgi:hypothetical protein
LVRASEFELRFVATAIHYAGWDRESSDYVFSEAGMILSGSLTEARREGLNASQAAWRSSVVI